MSGATRSELHPSARLASARLMLLYTPELCAGRDPLAVLAAALPHVDVIQVRPKPLGAAGAARSQARAVYDCALAVLTLLDEYPAPRPLVLVNDRVDVAAALFSTGIAGVHLGQEDLPVEHARRLLPPEALIGWSTHDTRQIAAAEELPLDYVGFGPVFSTATKGYERGLGAERAWLAKVGCSRPLFAIGGIDASNALELAPVGRAAVGSAILSAPDPGRAARELRELLEGDPLDG